MDVTYNGETLCVAEWARRFGISPQTVHHRIRLGWELEKALTTPVSKPPSKNDAEMYLNDMTLDKLPHKLRAIVVAHAAAHKTNGVNKKKYGRLLRDSYRSQFDAWFEEDYLPSIAG